MIDWILNSQSRFTLGLWQRVLLIVLLIFPH